MELMRFDSEQFGAVRILNNEAGGPWFCAADLCKSLGYANPRDAMNRHVPSEDVVKHDTLTSTGFQKVSYVNEAGLYALIFGSKLESARAFKRWVVAEVLPTLRKTGSFNASTSRDVSAVHSELLFVEAAARMLGMSNAGRLGMLQKIQAEHHLPNLLPAYAIDAPIDAVDGSSRPTFSATEGLKAFGIPMGAAAFNTLLASHGLLQKMTRPSTKTPNKQREFWSISARGLLYGKNLVDPRCQRETQPHWFQSRFKELLGVVGLIEKEAA